MYFAFNRGDAFPTGADNDVIQVYIDTSAGAVNFGSDSGVNWTGAHTLPFKAEWCFIYAPNNGGGADYINLRKWNGAAWVADRPWGGSAAKSTSAGIAEFSVALKDLGDTDAAPITKMRIVFYNNTGNNGNLWNSAPNANPTGNPPVTLTAYIQYDSLPVALKNPGEYYFTRSTRAMAAGDTRVRSFTPYIDGAKDPGWGDTEDATSGGAAMPDSSSTGDDGKRVPEGLAKDIYFTNNAADLYIGWEAMGTITATSRWTSPSSRPTRISALYRFLSLGDHTTRGKRKTTVYQYSADFGSTGISDTAQTILPA